MLTEIRYQNFRVLADAALGLSPFTLIVGPNGSGKSTAVRALAEMRPPPPPNLFSADNQSSSFDSVSSVAVRGVVSATVQLTAVYDNGETYRRTWSNPRAPTNGVVRLIDGRPPRSKLFVLDSDQIAAATRIKPLNDLGVGGSDLAGVLIDVRDQHPERFDELVDELQRWLPDFDHLLFQTPTDGHKSVSLRTRVGRHAIPATDLSQGTLFALALLTIAYLPNPPEVIAIEEPDRGIHPRLLREVRDALYRLAYPESFGEARPPVQVIATTHSPYLVDLFKDHPEEVVLTQKKGLYATFTRLTDQPNWEEIIRDAQLGDLWYSGVLGGVPAGS